MARLALTVLGVEVFALEVSDTAVDDSPEWTGDTETRLVGFAVAPDQPYGDTWRELSP